MTACKNCGESSPENFYRSRKTLCKSCVRQSVRLNRLKNAAYYKEFDRNRSMRPDRIELRNKTAERWRTDPDLRKRANTLKASWMKKNKEKRAAHCLVQSALKRGLISKKPCEICNAQNVDAHHDDYTQPLAVHWLCRKHHAELHRLARLST